MPRSPARTCCSSRSRGTSILDRVVNRMLLATAKALGADKVVDIKVDITPDDGIWTLRKLFGWRTAEASGVAVVVEDPSTANAGADRGLAVTAASDPRASARAASAAARSPPRSPASARRGKQDAAVRDQRERSVRQLLRQAGGRRDVSRARAEPVGGQRHAGERARRVRPDDPALEVGLRDGVREPGHQGVPPRHPRARRLRAARQGVVPHRPRRSAASRCGTPWCSTCRHRATRSSMLRVPWVIAETVPEGPLTRDARTIKRLLSRSEAHGGGAGHARRGDAGQRGDRARGTS